MGIAIATIKRDGLSDMSILKNLDKSFFYIKGTPTKHLFIIGEPQKSGFPYLLQTVVGLRYH